MANSELFILGDPRFISGGARSVDNTSYNNRPPTVSPTTPKVTSKTVLEFNPDAMLSSDDLIETIEDMGQQVHHGRDTYHARSLHPDNCHTRMNIFTPEGPSGSPTLGVEIETYLRPGVTRTHMCEALRSNWFHFEEDGSLDRELGHELITEVLHPRLYRDLRLWAGLQNIAAPYIDSWQHTDTGLHVHVGVDQFRSCPHIPAISPGCRVGLAKLVIAFVYYGFIDPSLSAKIMLRKDTYYCKSSVPERVATIISGFAGRKVTAADLFDAAATLERTYRFTYTQLTMLYRQLVGTPTSMMANLGSIAIAATDSFSVEKRFNEFSSHSSELNMDHPYTIEFRRGKGTLNAVSIHRMVEFTSLIVRYVWKLARTPDVEVTTRSLYQYLIDNTSSGALRKIVSEYIK